MFWSGTESIFLTVAGLWFGFVLKAVLITQGWFNSCWAGLAQSQELFCLSAHPSERLRVHRELGGTRLGLLTPNDLRDIPDHTWHHAQYIKLRMFRVLVFVFSSQSYPWWGPGLLRMVEPLHAYGQRRINSLLCLCAQFLLFLLYHFNPNP